MALAEPEFNTDIEEKPLRFCFDLSAAKYILNKSDEVAPSDASKAVLVTLEDIWENGKVLTYAFMNGNFGGTTIQRNKVSTIIKEWEKYANVSFRLVNNPNQALIRIAFNPRDGSWSYVGKYIEQIPRRDPTMNLGWVDKRSAINEEDRALVLHEFGHTLGMAHEHQSPLREGTLTLKREDVIREYMRTQGWTRQDVEQQVLNVLNEREVSNFTTLDLKSIMMYSMPAYLNEQGIEVKENTELSLMDKAFMQIHYPYFGGAARPEGMSFSIALEAMGIKGANADKLIEHFSNGDWEAIRVDFHAIYAAVRTGNPVPQN